MNRRPVLAFMILSVGWMHLSAFADARAGISALSEHLTGLKDACGIDLKNEDCLYKTSVGQKCAGHESAIAASASAQKAAAEPSAEPSKSTNLEVDCKALLSETASLLESVESREGLRCLADLGVPVRSGDIHYLLEAAKAAEGECTQREIDEVQSKGKCNLDPEAIARDVAKVAAGVIVKVRVGKGETPVGQCFEQIFAGAVDWLKKNVYETIKTVGDLAVRGAKYVGSVNFAEAGIHLFENRAVIFSNAAKSTVNAGKRAAQSLFSFGSQATDKLAATAHFVSTATDDVLEDPKNALVKAQQSISENGVKAVKWVDTLVAGDYGCRDWGPGNPPVCTKPPKGWECTSCEVLTERYCKTIGYYGTEIAAIILTAGAGGLVEGAKLSAQAASAAGKASKVQRALSMLGKVDSAQAKALNHAFSAVEKLATPAVKVHGLLLKTPLLGRFIKKAKNAAVGLADNTVGAAFRAGEKVGLTDKGKALKQAHAVDALREKGFSQASRKIATEAEQAGGAAAEVDAAVDAARDLQTEQRALRDALVAAEGQVPQGAEALGAGLIKSDPAAFQRFKERLTGCELRR